MSMDMGLGLKKVGRNRYQVIDFYLEREDAATTLLDTTNLQAALGRVEELQRELPYEALVVRGFSKIGPKRMWRVLEAKIEKVGANDYVMEVNGQLHSQGHNLHDLLKLAEEMQYDFDDRQVYVGIEVTGFSRNPNPGSRFGRLLSV